MTTPLPKLLKRLPRPYPCTKVTHLDDLLLRRTRLGLLLRNGAEELMPKVQTIAREELGWSDTRWNEEVAAYRLLIARCYTIPKAQT